MKRIEISFARILFLALVLSGLNASTALAQLAAVRVQPAANSPTLVYTVQASDIITADLRRVAAGIRTDLEYRVGITEGATNSQQQQIAQNVAAQNALSSSFVKLSTDTDSRITNYENAVQKYIKKQGTLPPFLLTTTLAVGC